MTHAPNDGGGDGDDRRPAVPVGEPAHRQGPEHEERARRRGDEDDDAVADPEAVADVRCQHRRGSRPRSSRPSEISNSMTKVKDAADRRGPRAGSAARRRHPGSRSSAKSTSSSAWAAWRSASASRTAADSDAASFIWSSSMLTPTPWTARSSSCTRHRCPVRPRSTYRPRRRRRSRSRSECECDGQSSQDGLAHDGGPPTFVAPTDDSAIIAPREGAFVA